ncbi:MAG TPA: hypothetical protein PKX92_05015 [Edaphocola sp.]|nr:hypothetical protein [Edaphocola sp.]
MYNIFHSNRCKKLATISCLVASLGLLKPFNSFAHQSSIQMEELNAMGEQNISSATITNINYISDNEAIVEFTLNDGSVVQSQTAVNLNETGPIGLGDTFPADTTEIAGIIIVVVIIVVVIVCTPKKAH